jgi:hypothetical protein
LPIADGREPGENGMSTYEPVRGEAAVLDVKSWAKSVLDRWLGFWFRPTDLTTLGAMRICAGLLFTYILLIYAYDLHALLGDKAWVDGEMMRKLRFEQPMWRDPVDWVPPQSPPLPRDAEELARLNRYWAEWQADERMIYAKGTPTWSIWFHVTDPTWMAVTHGLIILATLLFTVGFCTRVMAVVVWVASVSYVNRATTTYFGMDTMMNLLLIYLMVGGVMGAAGGALSVDRLLVRWWARRAGDRKADPAPSPLAQVSGNFVTRLLQINFCIIYMASGLSKLQGSSWWNGKAMWGVMANPEFNPLDFGPYMAYLTFLCRHRWLWEIVMHGGVLFTLFMELSFSYLVWLPRWRWVMIIGAVMLHTGIALVMGLVGFSLSMLTLLLVFVPPETVRRMANVIGEQLRPLLEAVTGLFAPSKEMALSR